MSVYETITRLTKPALSALLYLRLRAGKEDAARLPERKGISALPRPEGLLYWVHAASVGEAQSALTLIEALLEANPALNMLVTSGTVTSAALMAQRLPDRAFHQFYPIDHPEWVGRFLDHWRPDMALWMESELWPNMLDALRARRIPAALINARLSKRSYQRWKKIPNFARDLVGTFSLILAQTEEDAHAYRMLGAEEVAVTGNIKYSAAPLPCDPAVLGRLQAQTANRKMWVYASTHDGEEDLACRTHAALKAKFPTLLTIIVPRHPHRRDDAASVCRQHDLRYTLRGEDGALPSSADDIYIADTMGELGLFYKLAGIAMVGRSFSRDGGGGHNLIEPALLGCAVLTGPHVRNQQQVFDEMDLADAVLPARTEQELRDTLGVLLGSERLCREAAQRAMSYASRKAGVLNDVMRILSPLLPGQPAVSSDEARHAL